MRSLRLSVQVVVVLGACVFGVWKTAHHQAKVSTVHVMPKAPPLARSFKVPDECAGNTTGKLLTVSISKQHLWACDNTKIVYQSAVTTGASALKNVDDATSVGTWHIFGKYMNTTLKGCDANGCWNDPVAYWMPFDGSVGFHDASWQTFPFGSAEYATGGSHGCVHLPAETAQWIYGWAAIGTTVTIRT